MCATEFVRYATIHDVEALAPLFDGYRQFYGQASDLELARGFLTERFRHHESVILLAENAGAAVGFTQLYPVFSSVRAKRTYVLNDLFVAPSARKQGVASRLLKSAAEFGLAMGAARLSLSTAHTNQAAQRLYESHGWVRDSTFCYYNLTL